MERIAVLGAGAVGCYFGGMLARAGAPVTLIGRQPHVDAITRDGLFIDSIHFQEYIRVSATTDAAAARGAEIVLFCVKTVDTEEAAKVLAPHLTPGSTVVSLQNGVDNVERIHAAAGIDAVPAVVYVAAEMPAPGRLKHNGRGDLLLGELPAVAAKGASLDVAVQNHFRQDADFIASSLPSQSSPPPGGGPLPGDWLRSPTFRPEAFSVLPAEPSGPADPPSSLRKPRNRR